jgi:hypothetical protein
MSDARRPREELGALLRDVLRCPFCAAAAANPLAALANLGSQHKPLRVVAFRPRSIRLECRACGLRFSIDPENLADTFAKRQAPTPEMIERQAREATAESPGQYLDALAEFKRLAIRFEAEQRNRILGPHRQGVAAATPRKRPIRFPKR